MKEMSIDDMRKIDGGLPWNLFGAVARASAIARYYYEHRGGQRTHQTNYGFMGLRCPVCGKP